MGQRNRKGNMKCRIFGAAFSMVVLILTFATAPASAAPLGLTCPTSTGQVGASFSSALTPTGGAGPFTFSVGAGALPAGLSLSANTGVLSGTPTAAGAYNFSIKVT